MGPNELKTMDHTRDQNYTQDAKWNGSWNIIE